MPSNAIIKMIKLKYEIHLLQSKIDMHLITTYTFVINLPIKQFVKFVDFGKLVHALSFFMTRCTIKSSERVLGVK